MSEYTPDKWVILKLTKDDKTFYKVMGGWSGGYLDGQSWRVNSGITKTEDDGEYFLFYGNSGSVYKCRKTGYGTNAIMAGVLSSLTDNPNVTVLKEEDVERELR